VLEALGKMAGYAENRLLQGSRGGAYVVLLLFCMAGLAGIVAGWVGSAGMLFL
jgi:hypothetical protein